MAYNKAIVPVLMFHSIGETNKQWVWADMSESVQTFERTLARLAGLGFSSIGLDELYDYMAGGRSIPEKSVVLTFDDGYLDNWVNAVPLLRKYGMRGTVYVSPEFVDESTELRPIADDSNEASSDLNAVGFMNWSELREVDREGVLDVQCHALTHTWYFSGPDVVDVHRPADVYRYPWMSWNQDPSRKPYYLNEPQQQFVKWGHPVFAHEKSLIVKRFLPDTAAVAEIQNFVEEAGGEDFFVESKWQEILRAQFPALGRQAEFPGKFENDAEYTQRITHELEASKQILQEKLHKTVPFLSFPGGGVNDELIALANKLGYHSWTMSSWQNPGKRNVHGEDPASIKRVTGRSKVHWRGRWIANGGSWWIVHRMLTHQGSRWSKFLGALRKSAWIAGVGPGVRRPEPGNVADVDQW